MSLEARAGDVLKELERELTLRFGWTLFLVNVRAAESELSLAIRGTVLAPRTRVQILARLGALLPPGWALDATELREHRTADHRALTTTTRLQRKLPGTADNALATELRPEDGPVELLASEGSLSLVRAMDATIGWTSDALGASVTAPRLEPSIGDMSRLRAALESWIGVPYLLGGTLRSGVDCSALVQRCFRDTLGVVLPRHSSDQLAFGERSAPDRPETGDLLFVWTEHERPCHVGVVDGSEVVHASLSRRRVVSDPIDVFVRGASRVERVESEALRAAYSAFVGRSSIELPFLDRAT